MGKEYRKELTLELRKGEAEIQNIELETFENPAIEKDYMIHIEHPEFTCKCPRSGYPDFATIIVDYVPDKLCVELKSWKLYINSFRDDYKFHEAVTNEIYDTLHKTLSPRKLKVTGDFMRRGNVKTIVAVGE